MAHIYVANYGTRDLLDAERDDPSVKEMSLSEYAFPQFMSVFADYNIAAVDAMYAEVERDFNEMYGDESPTDFCWVAGEWNYPDGRRPYIEHHCYNRERTETYAVIVVQKEELRG